MAEGQRDIVFRYVRGEGYRKVAANGAHGGVTGRGDFQMDLFVEHGEMPNELIHSVTPDGLGPVVSQDPERPAVIREAQVGVVMSRDQARSLAHWILERLRLAEEARRGNA